VNPSLYLPQNCERRAVAVRAKANGSRTIVGHAAVFNVPSTSDLLGWVETIAPGAFTRALREKQDVRALINHSPDMLLGRVKTNTLRLAEDERGLRFECDLPDTSYARDLLALIKRGDLSQCSFGFGCVRDRWGTDAGGRQTREILDADIYDVSVVTLPLYADTDVSLEGDSLTPGIDLCVPGTLPAGMRALFPAGVPAELRSRIAAPAANDAQQRRKDLLRTILS